MNHLFFSFFSLRNCLEAKKDLSEKESSQVDAFLLLKKIIASGILLAYVFHLGHVFGQGVYAAVFKLEVPTMETESSGKFSSIPYRFLVLIYPLSISS